MNINKQIINNSMTWEWINCLHGYYLSPLWRIHSVYIEQLWVFRLHFWNISPGDSATPLLSNKTPSLNEEVNLKQLYTIGIDLSGDTKATMNGFLATPLFSQCPNICKSPNKYILYLVITYVKLSILLHTRHWFRQLSGPLEMTWLWCLCIALGHMREYCLRIRIENIKYNNKVNKYGK